jgi:hypothetical protein
MPILRGTGMLPTPKNAGKMHVQLLGYRRKKTNFFDLDPKRFDKRGDKLIGMVQSEPKWGKNGAKWRKSGPKWRKNGAKSSKMGQNNTQHNT